MAISCTLAEPGIAVITISDPGSRNALGPEEFEALATAWETLGVDASVRAVVVTGAGRQAFCSGARLDADFSSVADVNDMVDRALLKTRLFPKPLIAAVNGHCVAGGFELMLSCDLRVASAEALLGLPEVRWGILPSGGGAMKLIEQIGYARAMELLLTGVLIPARKAEAVGLVNCVMPAEGVFEQALQYARSIARNSPLAVSLTKRAALAHRAAAWSALESDEARSATLVRRSRDAGIGRDAFLGKREPVYPDLPD